MHYKNGRPAKAGDKVFNLTNNRAGVLHSITTAAKTCNARLALTSEADPYVTISECLHVDDITAATIPALID